MFTKPNARAVGIKPNGNGEHTETTIHLKSDRKPLLRNTWPGLCWWIIATMLTQLTEQQNVQNRGTELSELQKSAFPAHGVNAEAEPGELCGCQRLQHSALSIPVL